MSQPMSRPAATEHIPYFTTYISLVPGDDVLAALSGQIHDTLALLRSIPEERAGFRYAPGKWSIREVVAHVSDIERTFAFRAMRFGRQDPTALPTCRAEEDIRASAFDSCRLADLAEELEHVRMSTIWLLRHLQPDAWLRTGTAEGTISVRALAWVIAGHELHHVRILRERYL